MELYSVNEEKHIRTYQLVVVIASSLLVVGLLLAWVLSGPAQEWKSYQREFHSIWEIHADSLSEQIAVPEKGIHQLLPEGLKRTDRCITCHMGIENPYMKGETQPYASHPGDYLKHHPVEKYGCTICHGGQGRALNVREAHANAEGVHWNYPLLMEPYIESACGQCHLAIFSAESSFAGLDVFNEGQEIFNREGCLGCHKARGVGGILGPDLTEQGEKTRHEYDFQYIETNQTVANWLKEHFRDPEMVSPGSRMLKIDLPEKELDALSTFVLGLKKPDIDFSYFSLPTLHEFKGDRGALMSEKAFGMICSACHGKEGEGKDYEEYDTGVPAIMGQGFRAAVSEAYINFTLKKGRSQREMASWIESMSGLKEDELSSVATFVYGAASGEQSVFNRSMMRAASTLDGNSLFERRCATCHGEEGRGGSALALNRTELMKHLDDTYLFGTLMKGRPNAGMPSWRALASDQIYDLVVYLRSFGSYQGGVDLSFSEMDIDEGRIKFRFLCSRCHGQTGEGQTGPAIINKAFLQVASDRMLENVISQGRDHTPMFGWSEDVYNDERLTRSDIGNIVAYMRAQASGEPSYIHAGANPGDYNSGKDIYVLHCAECHGEEGEGTKAPALNNQELLSAASNGYLMATLALGRPGTAMPEWGWSEAGRPALEVKDRQDLVAWIRNWERIRIAY